MRLLRACPHPFQIIDRKNGFSCVAQRLHNILLEGDEVSNLMWA